MRNVGEKYNRQDAVMMISLYPKKGELYSAATSGVASYGKNVVTKMKRKAVILADYHGKKEQYVEKNTLVVRCFKTNTFKMWLSMARQVIKFDRIPDIFIQFDFSMYGNPLISAFIIPLLLIAKARNKKTTVILHHVIENVFDIRGHVGLGTSPKDTIKGHTFNFIFHTFYRLLGIVSNTVVILEEPLKVKLARFIPEAKIRVIPHGVDTKLHDIDKAYARRKLGVKRNEFYILFFGYVNWFKGTDLIVPLFSAKQRALNKKIRYILAGGKSPTMKNKHFYQNYFARVMRDINNHSHVEMTGYIPQNKLALYFTAADIIILPYRTFMTASGVFSLVLSFQKPFLLSKALGEMLDAPDFARAMQKTGLDKKHIVFDLTKDSAISTMKQVLENGLKARMVEMATLIKKQRSYENTAELYERLLYVSNPSWSLTKKKLALNIK